MCHHSQVLYLGSSWNSDSSIFKASIFFTKGASQPWTREGEETWFVTLIRAGRHPQGPPHWRLILRGGLALVPADLKPSPRSSRGAYRPENPPNNKCCAAGPFITRSPGLRASPRLVYSFLSQAALLARVGTALFLKRNRECKHF